MNSIWAQAARVGLFTTLFMLHVTVCAQQVSLDIEPKTLRLNESATVTLTFINVNPSHSPTLPDVPGFDIQYIGQEQQFQFINGAQERRLAFNYRLQPRATGQFRMGPFSINLNGQNIELEAIQIEVLPASGAAPGQSGQTIDDLVFTRIHLPRTNVFVQERFYIELAVCYRGVQLDRGIQLLNMPTSGLNLDDFQEMGTTREVMNNEIYEVRRFRLRGTALTAGTFELAPMVRVNVLVRRERQRDPFFGGFDDFFFGRTEAQPLTVPAKPMHVAIRPLPNDGRPETFGGAVGRFNMDLDMQPREVTAGDPITVTLRITGQGNFESISMPSLNLGDEFRRYDPKLIASGADHKVFEQVFIPRSDRITELPAISFSYFDPETASYETLVRGPSPLVVRAGVTSAVQVVQSPSALPAPDRAPLGIDILDLKRASFHAEAPADAGTTIPATTHVLPIVAIAGLFIWRRKRAARNRDHARVRQSLAPKSARAALRLADEAIVKGDSAAFHQSIWQALADYVAHRANLQAGEISPELVLSKVRAGGMAANHLASLESLLRQCEEARFARAGEMADTTLMKQRRQLAQELLRACEKVRLQ